VTILGVSPDSVKSHIKFKEKYQLPFPLLADEDHQCVMLTVFGTEEIYGREYEGVLRTTFLINSDGRIAASLRMCGQQSIVRKYLKR